MYRCTAYIPDMSRQDSKRARQRQRQARYEARQRAGIGLYPAPLGAGEIETLVALGWLQEGTVADRHRVGEAVAAAIRDMASRLRG
jgi:hypothetical protein